MCIHSLSTAAVGAGRRGAQSRDAALLMLSRPVFVFVRVAAVAAFGKPGPARERALVRTGDSALRGVATAYRPSSVAYENYVPLCAASKFS